MVMAYNQAASTQNLLRAFSYEWLCRFNYNSKMELSDFVKKSKQGSKFKVLADRISSA